MAAVSIAIIHLFAVLVGVSYVQSTCDQTAVQKCFMNLGQALGVDDVDGSKVFSFINPASMNSQQDTTCNALKDYDYTQTQVCIKTSGCAEESVLPAELANSPGVPKLTWSTISDLMQGLCEPGCLDLAGKNKKVEQCTAEVQQSGGSDMCGSLDKAFVCYRKNIGSCDVLVTFTESGLESSGILDMAKQQCPDVNLGLSSGKVVTASIVSTMFLALLVVVMNF